jgi:hypothetical protein
VADVSVEVVGALVSVDSPNLNGVEVVVGREGLPDPEVVVLDDPKPLNAPKLVGPKLKLGLAPVSDPKLNPPLGVNPPVVALLGGVVPLLVEVGLSTDIVLPPNDNVFGGTGIDMATGGGAAVVFAPSPLVTLPLSLSPFAFSKSACTVALNFWYSSITDATSANGSSSISSSSFFVKLTFRPRRAL